MCSYSSFKNSIGTGGREKKKSWESHSLSESLNFAKENQVLHVDSSIVCCTKSVHIWTVEKAPCHKARRAALCTAPPYTGTSHWATLCPSLPFLSGRQKGRKRDNHPQHPEAGVHWGSLERPCTENLPNANTACYNQNACSKKISTVQWQCFACCICQTEGAKTYSWLRRHKLYIFSLFPGCKESRVTIAIWCLSLQIQGKDVGGEPSAEGERGGGGTGSSPSWFFPNTFPSSHLHLFAVPAVKRPHSFCLPGAEVLSLFLAMQNWGAAPVLCTNSDGTWKRRWACHRYLLQCLVCRQDRRLSEVWVLFISHRREKKTKLLLKSYLRIEPEMKQRVSWIPQSSWDAI